MRYRVRKRAVGVNLLPWAVERPDGLVVWFARSQALAVPIAHMFAKRAQLHADLMERGLSGGEPTG